MWLMIDRIQLPWVAQAQELGHRARPDVDHDPAPTALDEVPGTGLARVRDRGRAPEDGESHGGGSVSEA